MFEQNFLVILSGLPASGKTTFSLKLKSFLEEHQSKFKVIVIDTDQVRERMYGMEFDPDKEIKVRNRAYAQIKRYLTEGWIVIYDDLNYYTSMRHDAKVIADNLSLDYFIIFISTPFKTCLKWNWKRGKPVPQKVIKKINKRFDDFNNYKWDVPLISLNLSSENITKNLLNDISIKIRDAIKARNKNQNNQFESKKIVNIYHENLEKTTRKIVGKILTSNKNFSLRDKLLSLRKEFIHQNLRYIKNRPQIERSFKDFVQERLDLDLNL